jgi:hypothetical protein
MVLRIARAVVDKQFGGEEQLASAVSDFAAARAAHAATLDVPAPQAHPLVEQIVLYEGGAFEIEELPAPPEADAAASRRMVAKSLIVRRLHEAGLLEAGRAALDADLYARERWYAPDRPAVYWDDPEALALLAAIGADEATVMAPAE